MRKGAGRPFSFTQEQAANVLSLRQDGLSLRKIAAATGLKVSTCQRICTGKAGAFGAYWMESDK